MNYLSPPIKSLLCLLPTYYSIRYLFKYFSCVLHASLTSPSTLTILCKLTLHPSLLYHQRISADNASALHSRCITFNPVCSMNKIYRLKILDVVEWIYFMFEKANKMFQIVCEQISQKIMSSSKINRYSDNSVLVTNSMDQSNLQANNCSASQYIPYILWNPKFHYHVYEAWYYLFPS